MLKQIENIKNFINNYLQQSGAKGVVLGMSGGKDSLICAKLCVDALGVNKVLGVIMPNGKMKDKDIAVKSCKYLGIKYYDLNIKKIYDKYLKLLTSILFDKKEKLSSVTTINLPPRLRMVCLYAIAGNLNYLVVNTSNLSEREVGYTTKWGDNVGDFAPLIDFTKSEVVDIGLILGLPKEWVIKVPDDGLSGQTDEDKMGFSYEELDNYIRNGKKGKNFAKILKMHNNSTHKRMGVIGYRSSLKNYFDTNDSDKQ